MGNDSGIVLDGLTDEQQALLDMFLEKEDFQAEQTEEEHPVIEPRPEDRHKPFPLTDIQLAYVIGRSNNALAMSNVSSHGYFEFSVDGLDPARYEAAWRKEIARHDMLRMIILPNGTQQVLEHVPPYRVPVNDFSAMDEAESGKAIQGIRERLQQKVKPLDEWPLFDIELTKLSGERWIIHLSLEGLTGDVKSMQIMMGEVQAFYNDPGLELKPLSLLFRDYVLSLENRRSMPSYKAAKDYWMKRIPDLPGGPVLPVLPDAEVVPLPEVKPLEQVLEPPLWNALQEKCSRHGLSPTSLLIAAFAEVVRRWNAEDDFCLNLTLFNRLPLHEEIDAIVGDFTDTLLLECRADDGRTFLDRALALRDRLWSDLDNHQFSGMDVLRELNRTRSEKENVYMPVVFTSTFLMGSKYGTSLSTLELGGHPVTKRFNSSQTPQLLIDHQVYEDHGELRVHWDVRSEFFRPGFLESMYGAFMDLLGRLAQDDAVWEAELVASLPAAEAGQRKAYNATKGPDGAGMLMHRLFLDRCETHPEALAAVSPEGQLSYAELRDRAAAVCRELRGRVACEELVAVIMPKCLDQLAAVIGIQWAGAAYLPIDPSMPEERVRAILASAGARFAVTTSQTAPNWPDGIAIVLADRLAPGPGSELAREPDLQKPENLAYVIYTSGSTGTPKGVMIEHRACVNTLLDVNERIQAGPRDRVLALSNLGFDLSVWDIFGLLAAGGCLVLPSQERIKEPAHWLELAERHGVTLWNTVPAMMRMLCDWTEEFAPNSACRLKAVLLSGDWLPLDLPERIQRLFGARVWSLGGATEASIWSIMYPVGKVDPRWKSIPYGYPMRNQTFHVLNERLEDCPCHVRGALYIGGAGLARGYFQDREKTDRAFIVHPRTGERLYRTGDLGHFSPEGWIVIQGREDNQVKVNGFRVELGEVEHAARQLEGVAEAVVMPFGDGAGAGLAAWLVPRGEDSRFFAKQGDGTFKADAQALEAAMAKVLAPYMVPSRWMAVDRLPVNRSGKIDRKALPAIAASGEDAGFEAPQTDAERRLAAIWRELLGKDRVGRGDNFFELGGDSLLATRLVGKIHQACGVELSVLSVYTMPVLSAMARSMAQPAPRADGLVLALNGTREGTPLFCIPGAEGSPVTFHELAARLEGVRPVFALAYPGMAGDEAPMATVEDTARRLLAEVRRVRPAGPYRLAGFCVGGLVAHAMAKELEAGGEDVRCLLLDAQLLPERFMASELYALCLYMVMNGMPAQAVAGLDGVRELDSLMQMAKAPAPGFEPVISLERLAAMDTDGRIVTLHAECTGRGWLGGMSLARLKGGFKVFLANMRASYRYRPLPTARPLPFLRAAENPEDPLYDPMSPWKGQPGLADVRDVAASHLTILHAPALDAVLDACARELA